MKTKKQSMTSLPQSVNENIIIPSSTELEESVLGGLMTIAQSDEKIFSMLNSNCFHSIINKQVFETLSELKMSNHPTDLVTVTQKCREKGILEHIGGAYTLTRMTCKSEPYWDIEQHALALYELFLRRKLIDISVNIINSSSKGVKDIFDVLDDFKSEIQSIEVNLAKQAEMHTIKESVNESIKDLAKRQELFINGKMSCISCGIKALDKITGGLKKGELDVIAARTSMGKTAIGLTIARNAAIDGYSVIIYSQEMKYTNLADRYIIGESGIDADRYKTGNISDDEFREIIKATTRIKNTEIFIDDTAYVSADYIHAKSKAKKMDGKCDLIIVDYLQLLRTKMRNKNYNKNDEVADCSKKMKALAMDLDVPVILLAQLNREVEKRTAKIPQLSDLRDSGSIEQDADIVMFIYRPEYYINDFTELGRENPNAVDEVKNIVIIKVAKNRNGCLGEAKFKHNGTMTNFYEDI